MVFDVDCVLVDVHGSFHRSILETVRHFTGWRVSRNDIHRWKNRSGYNDDWTLTHHWILALGHRASYAAVKRKFQQIYWGNHFDGNVARERWLLPRAALRRLARRYELGIFSGRTRQELRHTFKKFGVGSYFRRVVVRDHVRQPKPDPEGLLRILDGRDPRSALYVGDNVDDAIAARRAGIPFVGVLPRASVARRLRASRLRRLGAKFVLSNIRDLEKHLA